MIKVKKLVWDKWNLEHIKKHHVSKEEVKRTLQNLFFEEETYGHKLLVSGRCDKRLITVILSKQSQPGVFYTVTARDASKKERKKIYEIEEKNS